MSTRSTIPMPPTAEEQAASLQSWNAALRSEIEGAYLVIYALLQKLGGEATINVEDTVTPRRHGIEIQWVGRDLVVRVHGKEHA